MKNYFRFQSLVYSALAISGLVFSGCAIKTVVVDRHTLMEAEAAGEWPDTEKKILQRAKMKGATAFQKDKQRGKMAKPYDVLHGEMPQPKKQAKK